MQKPNINDIAKMTELSISTVSRVLNGKAKQYRIGIKSQQKVIEAAKKLQYVPNHFAANLKSGRSGTLALIIPSLNNPFFANIASEINIELRKLDYIVIISDSNENMETEKKEIQQLAARNIEGLIIVPCGDQWIHIKELENKGIPVVCIDRYFENLDIPYVSTDNFEGAFRATNYLIENGHKHIRCIQGSQSSTPNRLRVDGFCDAMKKAGLKNYEISGNNFTFENGYLETKLILQKENKPTAIFTFSNTIAMGCIKALREENIQIPKDISLITFDDHPYLDYLSTPLSCIAQPVSNISKMAVQFIYSKIQNQQIDISQVLLKPEMKLRSSVNKIN
ncbi:LacI family DNA-binding transcriptional regulator [Mariniflexile maritimum]|uniref:LacI family DNA-binding transcriptional regulator n=1 Tax=Mariniflexile maritimum TaxID=2682493 RepID=UPI0012F6BB68|nr:LacI family DNA-binding transcriptional regulator [Mariniflexile maritimum]